eukprot:gnl/MRDRNA2_/MRDRNA2_138191_c0_seq1.p1 gnl/MRDRNA2_/MRDRNA2_138191_c0~~gnl/MRDRNA2_/MRDRNA2_138191_c0_seq1.p1  ORF type:complete len:794 (-),score=134.63 gnl/MRDRNA2_/MRDRNA2_138191_c0_seq1:30-2411(-)
MAREWCCMETAERGNLRIEQVPGSATESVELSDLQPMLSGCDSPRLGCSRSDFRFAALEMRIKALEEHSREQNIRITALETQEMCVSLSLQQKRQQKEEKHEVPTVAMAQPKSEIEPAIKLHEEGRAQTCQGGRENQKQKDWKEEEGQDQQKDSKEKEEQDAFHLKIPTKLSQKVAQKVQAGKYTLSEAEVHHERFQAASDFGEFKISASAWELCILVGLPFLGAHGNSALVVSTVLNTLIQVALSAVVMTAFTKHEFMSVEEARMFRLTSAHDANKMDHANWVSLADRVCAQDRSLDIATAQLNAMDQIEEYANLTFFVPTGLVVCTTVLFIWVLSIAGEFRRTIAFITSVCAMKPGATKIVKIDESFVFVTISAVRRCFVLAMCLLRLCVASSIAVAGVIWLARTPDIRELLLNCAALGFILEIDELLDDIVLPFSVKHTVKKLKPLRMPQQKRFHWREIDCPACGMVTLCVLLTFSVFAIITFPMYQDLLDIRHELCDRGHRNFVIGASKDIYYPITVVGQTYAFGRTMPSLFQHVSAETMDEVALPTVDEGWFEYAARSAFFSVSRASFEANLRWTHEDDIIDAPGCYDSPFAEYYYYYPDLQKLRYLTGELSAINCEDFKLFCHQWGFESLRWQCPETCGCNSLFSGLLSTRGCKPECMKIRDAERKDMTCEDMPSALLSEHPGVRGFMIQYRDHFFISESGLTDEMSEEWLAYDPDHFFMSLKSGSSNGCNEVVKLDPYLCYPQQFGFMSIKPFCPVACGCKNKGQFANESDDFLRLYAFEGCPPSC